MSARPSAPQPALQPQRLCPYLIEARLGTFTVRGRARFPEGVKPPKVTEGAAYEGVTIPPGAITWCGESFELRVEGVASKHSDSVESELMYALYEGAVRPAPDWSGECRYRVDSITWEAPPTLEDRLSINGTAGTLICRDGVPVAVEFEDEHPEDFKSVSGAFKAIFAGVATLGEWQLTALPLASGKGEDWRHFDGRAEVVWHGADAWRPEAFAMRRHFRTVELEAAV